MFIQSYHMVLLAFFACQMILNEVRKKFEFVFMVLYHATAYR